MGAPGVSDPLWAVCRTVCVSTVSMVTPGHLPSLEQHVQLNCNASTLVLHGVCGHRPGRHWPRGLLQSPWYGSERAQTPFWPTTDFEHYPSCQQNIVCSTSYAKNNPLMYISMASEANKQLALGTCSSKWTIWLLRTSASSHVTWTYTLLSGGVSNAWCQSRATVQIRHTHHSNPASTQDWKKGHM